jgi:hypothetical protein
MGGLPPGQYRLVERFFVERQQREFYALAYFWIINPGDEPPPESVASGPARLEDVLFRVESPAEARRVITDRDAVISLYIENLSGKDYTATDATLEMKRRGKWAIIKKTNVNLGLIQRWQGSGHMLYLDDPLQPGVYRIRLSMRAYSAPSGVEPIYEFTVTPYGKAPEPQWDASRLSLSRYDASLQSESVGIALADPVLNEGNTDLEFTVSADALYLFGEDYSTDVLLDGIWYNIPFAQGVFLSIGYLTDPKSTAPARSYTCNLAFAYGVLPAGHYRMIKEFGLIDPEAGQESPPAFVDKVFALAEFMVEKPLDLIAHE